MSKAPAVRDFSTRNLASERKWPSVQKIEEISSEDNIDVEKSETVMAREPIIIVLSQIIKSILKYSGGKGKPFA